MKGPESALIEVHELPAPVRGLAVASFGMSFFALLVSWWIPFGFFLAVVATGLGLLSILLGVRTVARGILYPLGGMLIAGAAISIAMLSSKFSYLFFVEFH